MARDSIVHVIIVLVIGVAICSVNPESQKAISEKHWTTFYHIASGQLEECLRKCKIRYETNQKMRKKCIIECIVAECNSRYSEKKDRKLCIRTLYAKYIG
ncbi:uncharacterized protein DS421_5g146270 [Arachis hypogaea]|nr:uncharacterized protein DS421_5g146270 [Arachis hypogaea]